VTSPEYFRVMRTRIVRGRALEEGDRVGTPPVVVVSAAMADLLWPGRDPLGECIRIGIDRSVPVEASPCRTVVGVAESSAQQSIDDEQRLMYYLPLDQVFAGRASMFYVRVQSVDVTAMLEPVRRELTRAMPGDGLVVVRPLQEILDNQMRPWRLGATLFLTLGGLAFVVAAVGLYGVIAFGVAGRINEIGVRIALGASPARVIALVVRDGLGIALGGSAAGLLVAWSAARWLEPLLFHQSARDPVILATVLGLVVGVALLASAIPARRATRVDPMQALRVE
jgi:ABC-type lipoprotein release transport system permease subunit